jgi:CubicO group peptidase (beta-lactamase class C family)
MKSRFAVLVLLLLSITAIHGAQVPAAAPARAQSVFVPDRIARLDALLQRYVDEGHLAGAVALVLRDGRPVYEHVVGWSDKEAGRRMTADTIFRIASQTKAITSVAILSLVEEGRLALEDPVSRYIPAFAHTTVSVAGEDGRPTIVPAERPITIRHLLTHTSGISYGTGRDVAALYEAKGLGPAAGFGWYLADKDEPICDTMSRLATLPFAAQPGQDWVYGYSSDVLGCVVERASGMPLDRFIETRITGPLGMRDTHFFLPERDRARLAAVYTIGDSGTIVRAPEGGRGQGDYVTGPRRDLSGGAGLLSTARDHARFLEMIRRGGEIDGVRILSPRTVALMRTDQVGDLYPQPGLGFGMGFEVVEKYGGKDLASVGAYGWGGAYGTEYRIDPDAHLVMVFMQQLVPNTTDIGRKFPTLVYQALQEK